MSRRRLPTPRAPTLRAIAASSRATSLRAPRSRAASSRTRRSVAARSRTPASSFSDATRMAACSAAIVSARARRPASSARSRSLSTQTSQDTARRSPIREMWRSSARCESWDPVTRDAPTAITCNAVSPPAVGGQIYGAAACIGLGDVASNADGSRSASAPRPVARARNAGTDVLLPAASRRSSRRRRHRRRHLRLRRDSVWHPLGVRDGRSGGGIGSGLGDGRGDGAEAFLKRSLQRSLESELLLVSVRCSDACRRLCAACSRVAVARRRRGDRGIC